MYATRGYWVMVGTVLAIAVVLGLTVGGYQPLDRVITTETIKSIQSLNRTNTIIPPSK